MSFLHRIPNISKVQELKEEKLKYVNNILILGIFFLLFGLYSCSDFYKINNSTLDIYKVSDNSLIVDDINIIYSKPFDNIVKDLTYDKMVPINNNITEQIYIKRKADFFTYIFLSLSITAIILSLFMLYTYLKQLSYKKYLKFVE